MEDTTHYFKAGNTVTSRDGEKGKTTGSHNLCQMSGCNGLRIGTRWADGKLTYPCTKGMNMIQRIRKGKKTITWKII